MFIKIEMSTERHNLFSNKFQYEQLIQKCASSFQL